MKIKKKAVKGRGIKVSVEKDGKEVARAFLYILHNELHKRPFGFLEDVYINKPFRDQGLGTTINKEIIKLAQKNKCYKLIGTSRYTRPKVHKFYKKLGYKDWGKEFKIKFR
jgi:GNAT superfamily N-acetyltransferase